MKILACALMLAIAGAPPLAEDIDFQEGQRLIDELDYERAVFRFQKLSKSDRPAGERATAFAWLGLTYANLGDEGEGLKAFVNAIKLDPLVVLPPSSPKVAQLFDKARQEARESIRVDRDSDGILDGDDKCPEQPETMNGYDDADGCPDERPAADADGDGIVGDADLCPADAETKNGFQDGDGCPDEVPPKAAEGISPLFVSGLISAGAGLVGIGTGVGLGVVAQGANDDAIAAAFQDERREKAIGANNLAFGANVAYIVGGGLLATGAVLLGVSLVGGE